jgi:hypothetical protein
MLTSNFFSILYYNSEVWHISTLKSPLQKQLLLASAKALRATYDFPGPMISYLNLHKMANRGHT